MKNKEMGDKLLIEEKKEVQRRIVELPQAIGNGKATEGEFLDILRLVSPGTNLRTALEGIVKSGRGTLIVVENEFTNSILEGGFKINARFTHQKLVELAKMDAAIILSPDMKKIMHANVLLTPEHRIPSNETGTRHKAAERTAKMTGTLVIAISERKSEINLYYKNIKYNLKDAGEVLRKTTSTMHILEKQREMFDKNLEKLHHTEIKNELQLEQACRVLQQGESMERLLKSIEKNILELGNEGYAIKSRLKEIMKGINTETHLVIKDYTRLNVKKSQSLLDALTYDELLETDNIAMALAQKDVLLDSIKGWRALSRTSLSEQDIALLVKEFRSLDSILKKEKHDLSPILGEEKSEQLVKEVKKMIAEVF